MSKKSLEALRQEIGLKMGYAVADSLIEDAQDEIYKQIEDIMFRIWKNTYDNSSQDGFVNLTFCNDMEWDPVNQKYIYHLNYYFGEHETFYFSPQEQSLRKAVQNAIEDLEKEEKKND